MILERSTLCGWSGAFVPMGVYAFFLIFSSLTYELTFQLLYFTLPMASLCFPLLFLLAAVLAEILGVKKCLLFVMCMSFFNGILIQIHCPGIHTHLNDFWLNNELSQFQIYTILTIGYHVSVVVAVLLVGLWKRFSQKRNYAIIIASAFLANFIDLIFMWPTLYAYMGDNYITSWKLLTIATFKTNSLFLYLPLGWLLLRHSHQSSLKPPQLSA